MLVDAESIAFVYIFKISIRIRSYARNNKPEVTHTLTSRNAYKVSNKILFCYEESTIKSSRRETGKTTCCFSLVIVQENSCKRKFS